MWIPGGSLCYYLLMENDLKKAEISELGISSGNMKTLKAAIFDLNGIFFQSPKLSERFAKDFGVPTAEFLSKLSEIMDKVRQPGAGSAFEYWRPALKDWNIDLPEQEFWRYWFGTEVQSESMIAFARELRNKGIKVFILSNNFKERSEYYGHYPWIHDTVDKVYFSWQTGFVKPDPRAWELVIQFLKHLVGFVTKKKTQ